MSPTMCPCGSLKQYADCCEPYITSRALPKTPEQLMRSRYTAYTQADIDYIKKTMRGTASLDFNKDRVRQWAEDAEWLGLMIVENSAVKNKKGFVEFIASYQLNQKKCEIHERSEFHFINHRWYYVDGNQPF